MGREGKEGGRGEWTEREEGGYKQRKQILIQILIPSFTIYDTSMVSVTDIIATYR